MHFQTHPNTWKNASYSTSLVSNPSSSRSSNWSSIITVLALVDLVARRKRLKYPRIDPAESRQHLFQSYCGNSQRI